MKRRLGRFWILDFGFWILDWKGAALVKPQSRKGADIGSEWHAPGVGLSDCSPNQNPKSKIQNTGSPIQNPKSPIPNPKSKIQNPKFEGPKSKIQNPKSKISRRLGPREKLLLCWAVLAFLLLLTGKLSNGQGQASSNVTFTVGTYLDVRYVCDGSQVWTVVATSRDFCATRDFLSKGNRPYVVRGTLQVLSGSGTWSFDMNPWQWGNQSTVSRPAGTYTGLATVRYSQPKGKVVAKARLTLSIVAQ